VGHERCVLAIDLGSGSVKVALVSKRAEVVASANRPIRTELLPGGGAEQDPDEWWAAAVDAARAVLHEAALAPEQVVAVRCVTQWAVTVPVDAEGRALANALSWLDVRGGPHSRRITDGRIRVGGYDAWKLWRWVRLTGAAPARTGGDGLGHVLWFQHERPDLHAKTHKFLEPMDYLNLRLTGRFAASVGTIFPYWLTDNRDPNRIRYDDRLLRMAGVDRAKLPDLVPVDAVVGPLRPDVAAELGLRPETPVLAGACDGPAATIGAGAVEDYQGYFYIGTTSWLSCHVPAKKTDLRRLLSTMPSVLPGRYMVMAEQGVAGRCLEFLKDALLYPRGEPGIEEPANVWEVLDASARSVRAGSDGLLFTPWIHGVLAPVGDGTTRSAFFNQSLRTKRAHYVRAVMEGVAYNLRWLRGAVQSFVGRSFPELRFIGGGAQSDTWCGILADVLGCPVRQIENPRFANAVGGALAAFVALGEIRADEIPGLVRSAAVHHPDPANRALHDELFAEFLELYRATKPIYRRLNGRRRGSRGGASAADRPRPTG
jgi:xylulokinase